MKKLLCLALLATGCASGNYVYNFDLTDPGAKNIDKPGERDVLEDDDMKSEILVDPTSFQAIVFAVTNKTQGLIDVRWDRIILIGPDKMEIPIHPDDMLGSVEPGGKVVARLIPFALPSQGPAAAGYEQAAFQLVVPMVVRGIPREARYHLVAHLKKL